LLTLLGWLKKKREGLRNRSFRPIRWGRGKKKTTLFHLCAGKGGGGKRNARSFLLYGKGGRFIFASIREKKKEKRYIASQRGPFATQAMMKGGGRGGREPCLARKKAGEKRKKGSSTISV